MFNLTQYGFQHHRMIMRRKHECIHIHNTSKVFSCLSLTTMLLGISLYHQNTIKAASL